MVKILYMAINHARCGEFVPTESEDGVSIRYCCSVCWEKHTLSKPLPCAPAELLEAWRTGVLLFGEWRVYDVVMSADGDDLRHEVTLVPA